MPHPDGRFMPVMRGAAFGALLAGLSLVTVVAHADDTAPEAALKAAFVFNFTKFVEWPDADALSKFSLCTVGGGLAADALGAFEGKQALGKPIQVVQGPRGAALRGCQLVFISEAGVGATPEVLAEVRNTATLTVSDSANFIDNGGAIALVREGGRLRFEINLGLAQARGLKVGAQLLRLAKSVREGR